MLVLKDESLTDKARRIRWFGIDRKAKQGGNWENDITEVGYKYQMTDIGAALELAALEEFDWILSHRQTLLRVYEQKLARIPEISFIGGGHKDRTHEAWMCIVVVGNRLGLMQKLHEQGIESSQAHYRNDRYSVFIGRRSDYPNMDALEDRYWVLPLHTKMSVADVERICGVLKSGW